MEKWKIYYSVQMLISTKSKDMEMSNSLTTFENSNKTNSLAELFVNKIEKPIFLFKNVIIFRRGILKFHCFLKRNKKIVEFFK